MNKGRSIAGKKTLGLLIINGGKDKVLGATGIIRNCKEVRKMADIKEKELKEHLEKKEYWWWAEKSRSPRADYLRKAARYL